MMNFNKKKKKSLVNPKMSLINNPTPAIQSGRCGVISYRSWLIPSETHFVKSDLCDDVEGGLCGI